MKRLLILTGLLCAALGLILPARAQVQASLVSSEQSVRPGQTFEVALRLVHQPHWHTYWINPGTGLPTTLSWHLPEGWKAGPINWPTPEVLKDSRGNLVGNGYDGDLLLPVEITVAADAKAGGIAELRADAAWLMCQDECRPGNASLNLPIRVAEGEPVTDPQWNPLIQATLKALPTALSEGSVSAVRNTRSVVLTYTSSAAGAPSHPHFFSQDGLIASDAPQVEKPSPNGFVLTLPISADGPQNPTRLVGVLAAESWGAGDPLRGHSVDVSLADKPIAAPSKGLGATLVLAFLGGLVLNLMPCVFPVLGIKILGFVNQAGSDRRKVIAHGLVFSLGVILSFWTLAGVLAVLRAGGDQLGWGFQLQSAPFTFALAAVMLVFGLNMSGVFEFGLSATSVGSGLQSRSGLAGSFFTGVLATVVATPCSAPFLAPALGAALSVPALQSFALFTAIALGLSAPYLLLSIFPAATKVLPRPGAWMETFKQFMAFPLYATAAALVWVLAGQVSDSDLLSCLLGLVGVAMALWLYGRCTAPGASAGRVRFGMLAGLALGASGLWMGWPLPAAPDALVWEKWSPEAVAKLQAEDRIVYVDFTARWCATCQANKKLVFHSKAVLDLFKARHVATLRGDWTNRDSAITAELAKYHRSAVPFNQVWLPGQAEPVLLPELLTPGDVLTAVGK